MSEFIPEILAPAGNLISLKAAIAAKADAVYLGLNKFNAREKADNFTLENIGEVIDYAHLFGVKVYITMNTLLKDTELDEAINLTRRVWNMGADAFIVQDLGFTEKLKGEIPEIVLHASTQMGIHNYLGAITAEKLGFKRVILSRETTLEDIKLIKEKSNIELEFFVHGALCVAFSGNCYFSSLASGYSGNRGRCMQLCRKKYVLSIDGQEKSGYYLSAKDIMLADKLKQLSDAGISSFKIEGRLRRPEYVAVAVQSYKKALKQKLNEKDRENLKLAFNRGDFCGAYLDNNNDIIYPLVQNHIGIKRGYITYCDGKTATLSEPLKAGDGIKFLHSGSESGSALLKNDGIKTGFSGNPQKGDEVRLTSSEYLTSFIKEPKIPITAEIEAFKNSPLRITLKADNFYGEAFSDFIIEPSKNASMKSDDIAEQIKLKDTEFKVENLLIRGDDNIFIPKSIINSTRRSAVSDLKNAVLNSYKRTKNETKYRFMSDIIYQNSLKFLDLKDIIQIDTPEKSSIIPKEFNGYIAVNPENYSMEYLNKFRGIDNVILALPNIARGKDIEYCKKAIESGIFQGYIINNLYGIELLKNKKIIFGWQMNLINSQIKYLKISSPEADKSVDNLITFSFGYVPTMTFAHCPRRSMGFNCQNCPKKYDGYLKDEKNNTFKIVHYSLHYCYARLLNMLPLYNNSCKGYKFIDLSELSLQDCSKFITSILKNEKINAATTKGNIKRGLI